MIIPGLPFGLAGIERPKFVGGRGYTYLDTAVTTATVPLTSLTGGVGSSPQAGDLVVVVVSNFAVNEALSAVTSGYTKIAESIGSGRIGVSVFAKRLSSSETSFSVSGSFSTIWSAVVHVWRNMNASQIIDVTSTTTGSGSNGLPNPPSITTATPNSVVLAVGALDASITAAPSGMANFFVSTDFANLGIASILRDAPGAYDPGVFSGSSTTPWSAATIALRPK